MVGKRILLANDPDILRAVKNSFFGRSGFVLLVAETEQQAFELIEEQDPALAVFNLDQSGINGDVCCRRVKDDPILRGTPIILVIHPGVGDQDLARCQGAGCDGILNKPIDPGELMNTACRLLNIDKRGASRVDVRLDLRWGKDAGKLGPGRILNMNSGGAYIAAEKLFPINTEIILDFTLPGSDRPLLCGGRVAWVNHPEWIKTSNLPTGMGVRFVDLAQEDLETLRNFLDRLSREKP